MSAKRVGALVAMVSAAVMALTACGDGGPAGTRKTVELEASWAVAYHSVADLKKHSQTAAQGHFSKVLLQQTDRKSGVLSTDFEFTVDKVLYAQAGRVLTPGSAITVHQTGGVVDGAVHQVKDDPLFTVSETCVLFLEEYEPGSYMVVGGPTGRFEVKGGAVTPVNDEGPAFQGSADDFAAAVANS
ncbi:hypothetical protein [Streptomyces sp. FH025]|uniref:hypothetical protein n=1 Tax=Streptomyces sp. FH025 TaxID=2815937 RepID=UPI001A9DF808|nr:hypothetical protein [Streptomyces sp. FH025]MBO1413520.1 hypothetical protein [Streptomyces sp. FH025]